MRYKVGDYKARDLQSSHPILNFSNIIMQTQCLFVTCRFTMNATYKKLKLSIMKYILASNL